MDDQTVKVIAGLIIALLGLALTGFGSWYVWRSLKTGRATHVLRVFTYSRSEHPGGFWFRVRLAAIFAGFGAWVIWVGLTNLS
jgi:hypothetical protein